MHIIKLEQEKNKEAVFKINFITNTDEVIKKYMELENENTEVIRENITIMKENKELMEDANSLYNLLEVMKKETEEIILKLPRNGKYGLQESVFINI